MYVHTKRLFMQKSLQWLNMEGPASGAEVAPLWCRGCSTVVSLQLDTPVSCRPTASVY